MYIVECLEIHGSDKLNDRIVIPELDRDRPSVSQFISLSDLKIELTKPTAFIYIDGVSLSPSETGARSNSAKKCFPVIKTVSAYCAHAWAGSFISNHYLKSIEVLSGTCAAGVQAIKIAHDIINYDFAEEVIIIGGERITDDTVKLFKELNIPILCGDGFAYVRCSKKPYDNKSYKIIDPKWLFSYRSNPFEFKKGDINKLKPNYTLDYVKLHGTGTESNTEAESGIAELGYNIVYKNVIGHTQGVSALLESVLVMQDDDIKGNIMVSANGLGGYYGSFTIIK